MFQIFFRKRIRKKGENTGENRGWLNDHIEGRNIYVCIYIYIIVVQILFPFRSL